MSGIIFYKTDSYKIIDEFYRKRIGMEVWLKQTGCTIYKHDNMLLGFCDRGIADKCGIITFFYKTRNEVDDMYEKLKEISSGPPKDNPDYNIYHFWAEDPEGRILEFQVFL